MERSLAMSAEEESRREETFTWISDQNFAFNLTTTVLNSFDNPLFIVISDLMFPSHLFGGKEVKSKHDAVDVVDLLLDTNCVGLKPNFSMIEKVISSYWDMGKNERAVLFVKEFLRREIAYREDGMEGHKGGPTGYLAWKMMANGKYRNAANLVIDLRESGLRPEIYCYVMAMTAMVKELNELAKALCNLKGFRSLV
ncbi:hypothetical protein ACSBR1_002249 [Camellia fascicularis]